MKTSNAFKSLLTMVTLVVMAMSPQQTWASTHYDAGYESTSISYSSAGMTFTINNMRIYNYQGSGNSYFSSNPEVKVTVDGSTHTFNLNSLYTIVNSDEKPFKTSNDGNGNFRNSTTYEQTQNNIKVKAYFSNHKFEQTVSGSNNGGGSSKWCTANLVIEIATQSTATISLSAKWKDHSDGVNNDSEDVSWSLGSYRHTCNSNRQSTDSQYHYSNATCTSAARYYYSCSLCYAAQSGTFNSGSVLGHTASSSNVTYTWSGQSFTSGGKCYATLKCGRCSSTLESSKELTVSSYAFTDATCTTAGSRTWKATGSNSTYSVSYSTTCSPISKAALGHDYTSKTATSAYQFSPATCLADATYYYKCSRCTTASTSKWTHEGSALGHYWLQTVPDVTESNCFRSYTMCVDTEWTKTKTFTNDAGYLQLGSSSSTGNIQSPSDLDLTSADGKVSVVIKGRPYGSDANVTLKVSLMNGSTEISSSTATLTGTSDNVLNVKLSGVTSASDYIRIATTVNDKRALINSISLWKKSSTPLYQVSAANCTEAGVYKEHCGRCFIQGDNTFVHSAALGHNFTDETRGACDRCMHGFIRYTSSTDKAVTPNIIAPFRDDDGNALTILSNTYTPSSDDTKGQGVIEFDGHIATIGQEAFFGAALCDTITIPGTVTRIDAYAFYGCKEVTNIGIPSSLSYIGDDAFAACNITGSLVIPNTVDTVGYYAFYDNREMTDVTVYDTKLLDGAFSNCTKLMDITLDRPTLLEWPFNLMNNSGMVTVHVRSELVDSYKNADGWKQQKKVICINHDFEDYVSDGNTTCITAGKETSSCHYCVESDTREEAASAMYHQFADDDQERIVCTLCNHGFFHYTTIGDTVTTPNAASKWLGANGDTLVVKSNTYDVYSAGGTIEFSKPIATIGSKAFLNNSSLCDTLTIPYTVIAIGDSAFANCEHLTGDLVIPYGVSAIGKNAFNGCQGLGENLTISESVDSIGEGAFLNCDGIKNLKLLSIPRTGEDAFNNVYESAVMNLTDNSHVYTGTDSEGLPSIDRATYTRPVTNEWGTLVLPFNIDYDANNGDYILYTLSDITSESMIFSPLASGETNPSAPMVFRKLEGDTLTIQSCESPYINRYTSKSMHNGWNEIGTYTQLTNQTGMYYIARDKFWKADEPITIKPFRAWFDLGNGSAYAKCMNICISDTPATGIDHVQGGTNNQATVYNLNGQRLAAPQKGHINIINGQKVFVK